jgi:hypothetical protein
VKTVAVSLELGALDLDQAASGKDIEIVSNRSMVVVEYGRD